MESKTLNAIQTISKVGKILSKVTFICCLVGGICCIVGMSCFAIPTSLKVGGVTIYSPIDGFGDYSPATCYTAMLMGLITCASICVVARLAERYFGNELAAGTPFTLEGARELLRLGICTICIPLGATAIAQACYAFAIAHFAGISELHTEGGAPVVLGVAFIVASLICKYGAELKGAQAAS